MCVGNSNADDDHEVDIWIYAIFSESFIDDQGLKNVPKKDDANPPALNQLAMFFVLEPPSCFHGQSLRQCLGQRLINVK